MKRKLAIKMNLLREVLMINRITHETRELWWDNIVYLIDNAKGSESAAEDILEYLEGEGAFAVIDDDK